MKKLLLILSCIALLSSLHAQVLFTSTTNGGISNTGTISKYVPASNALSAAFTFQNVDGISPQYTKLIQANNGKLYGVTAFGGNNNYGVIFSYDPVTSTYAKVYNFEFSSGVSPYGSLIQAGDGKLYGITRDGGLNYNGVIFSFDPATYTYQKLYDFDGTNGGYSFGSLMQASNGKLYGMTRDGGSSGWGVLYSFDIATATYTKLKDFTGANGSSPYGSLIQAANGKLYGMTAGGGAYGGGVIFSYNPSTAVFAKVKDLNDTTGTYPVGSLIQASNGKLYGMTSSGGANYNGVMFSFNIGTSTYTKLKDFDLSSGYFPYGSLMQATDGKLWGMTSMGGWNNAGVIFSYDPATAAYTRQMDFDGFTISSSYCSLMQATNGKLYGLTTCTNTNFGNGVLFSFDPASAAYTKLKDFGSNSTGAYMYGGMIRSTSGPLYGMTQNGGSNGFGVLFSFNTENYAYTKLIEFNNTNGAYPYGSPMQAISGKIYGMTYAGGVYGKGVFYSFDPNTNTYTKLKDFDGINGQFPKGSLVQANNGKLYGVTSGGGSKGAGVLFSFDVVTSTFTKLKDFDNTSGYTPNGTLVQAGDGKLYGMAYSGGNSNVGTIFSYDPATTTLMKVYDFSNAMGAYPFGSLVAANDGKLYGMTNAGGANSLGTLFSFNPSTLVYTKLKDLDNATGRTPYGSLMQAQNGKLYGMASAGIYGAGTIFSYDPATAVFTKLNDFNGTNGKNPWYTFFVEAPCTMVYYKDEDGDGYGNPNYTIKECTQPVGYVANSSDCDDSNPAVYPGAPELCDGIDNNCDGVTDEDCAVAQFKINDVSQAEGDNFQTNMLFNVTLTQAATKTVTVTYKTVNKTAVDPKDFIAQVGSLSFPPGIKKKNISIAIKGDTQVEPNEKFQVVLSNPVNAIFADSLGVGTILNDDTVAMAATMMTMAQEKLEKPVVTVSPNPASSTMNVQLKGYNGNTNIQLLDMQGKVLQEAKLRVDELKLAKQQFNVSSLANGTYFIVVKDERGNAQSTQVSIAH